MWLVSVLWNLACEQTQHYMGLTLVLLASFPTTKIGFTWNLLQILVWRNTHSCVWNNVDFDKVSINTISAKSFQRLWNRLLKLNLFKFLSTSIEVDFMFAIPGWAYSKHNFWTKMSAFSNTFKIEYIKNNFNDLFAGTKKLWVITFESLVVKEALFSWGILVCK